MHSRRKGMTIAELLVASTLAVTVLTGILVLSQFAQTTWRNERLKSRILGELQIAMERIQKELRYSDLNRMFYYPDVVGTYTAVSFPHARDEDDDGFIEIDSSARTIVWDETVIYHTYVNASGKTELRRTVFRPRGTPSNTELQEQLNDVAEHGQPVETTPGYEHWNSQTGTRVLVTADTMTLDVAKAPKLFDGYGETTERSENVAFGSIPLTAGQHYITFTVVGKNAASSGYRLGVDSFSVSPSGAPREGEEATIRASGEGMKSAVNEEMTGYGSWSGNRHLEYQATAVDDYLSLDFVYDEWIETNFATTSPSGTIREYDNRTGDGDEEDGENEYAISLPGGGAAWDAADQIGSAAVRSGTSCSVSGGNGWIVRNIIRNDIIGAEGRAIRITFDNTGSAESLPVDYAGIISRSDGPDSDGLHTKQISVGGLTSFTIPAGGTAVSDWIDINNFDKTHDYLLTMHLAYADGNHTVGSLAPSPPDTAVYSYVTNGTVACASAATWTGVYTNFAEQNALYGLGTIEVSYASTGVITSQIFDTAYAGHQYGNLSWRIAKNNYGLYASGSLGADVFLKVRSGNDIAALQADTDWSDVTAVDTRSQTSGTQDLSLLAGNGRYVQFQAAFSSLPTVGGCDYTKSCILQSVAIAWPGQARVVGISGYFTKRPDYGIFTVSIDGYELNKTLEVDLGIGYAASGGRTIERNLAVEIEPRNTGR